MTEPYILCGGIQIPIAEPHIFCWDIQIPTGKKETLQYRNYFKYDRTLHLILCGDIQIPIEKCSSVSNDFEDHKTLHPLWKHSNPS